MCGGETAGNSLPSPWSGQLEEHNLKRQDYVPADHLDTAWNVRQQWQQSELCVWQYQECSVDIREIFHSPSCLEERFSSLQNYIKIQFDWQVSAFSTIDANFINWLCCQQICPYTPSHCFCRWRLRETARICVYLTYTFTNVSMLYWNLKQRGEIHMRNSNRCMAGFISPNFRHPVCRRLHLSQPACAPFIANGEK